MRWILRIPFLLAPHAPLCLSPFLPPHQGQSLPLYFCPTAFLTPNQLLWLMKQQSRPPCRYQNRTSKPVPGLKPKLPQLQQQQPLPRIMPLSERAFYPRNFVSVFPRMTVLVA